MTITADNLLSGILGALIGALATYGAVRLQLISTAKERLAFLVLSNGHRMYFKASPTAAFYTETIAANIADAHALYLTIRRGVFFCKRKRLDEAWNKYCGAEFRKDIPPKEPGYLFARGAHTRDSALSAIIELVGAVHDA